MATQAATLESTREQLATLEAEVSESKTRLATEETDLATLERERISVEPSKVPGVLRKIEIQQATIDRLRAGIATKQPRIDELWGTVRREEEEARRAAALAVVAGHEGEGLAALDAIEKHFTAAAADFEKLAEARKKLEHQAQDSLWAPMQGRSIPSEAARANQALAAFGERLRILIERTGWMPKR